MIIKIADNETVYKECCDYLEIHKVFPIKGTDLLYVKDNEKIIGVAGYCKDTGCTIDPLVTDSAEVSWELYKYLTGVLFALGYKHIQVFTNNEVVIRRLTNKEGFRKVDVSTIHLIREI